MAPFAYACCIQPCRSAHDGRGRVSCCLTHQASMRNGNHRFCCCRSSTSLVSPVLGIRGSSNAIAMSSRLETFDMVAAFNADETFAAAVQHRQVHAGCLQAWMAKSHAMVACRSFDIIQTAESLVPARVVHAGAVEVSVIHICKQKCQWLS